MDRRQKQPQLLLKNRNQQEAPQRKKKKQHSTKLLIFFVVCLCIYPLSQIYFHNYDANNTKTDSIISKNNLMSSNNNIGYFRPSQSNEGNNEVTVDEVTVEKVPPITPTPTTIDGVAGLSCKKFDGPSDEIASEMVYWEDIPSDSTYINPLVKNMNPMISNNNNDDGDNTVKREKTKYLTFEPDEGGWNNIRMAMETVTTLALAMGRTLVLPPKGRMYLLTKKENNQKDSFSFTDFFHLEAIVKEHSHILNIITFEEFLSNEGITGHLIDKMTNKVSFPPDNNRTNWDLSFDGNWGGQLARHEVFKWLHTVTQVLEWDYSQCIASFPILPGIQGEQRLNEIFNKACCNYSDFQTRTRSFDNNPVPVDSELPEKRLEELLAHRTRLCIYDNKLQHENVIHVTGDNDHFRMLVHFYAFLYFEDWKQDLWTKRFVRDHLRYIDEIQCTAADIVHKIRQLSIKNGNEDGIFDTMHIRRGDFQYHDMKVSFEELYEKSKEYLQENSTIYIATDERNKDNFAIFRKHYNIYFLDDFSHQSKLLSSINTNYYGMLDQLIASRGRTFFGTYLSTFTGYINRLRGYHSQKQKLPGYEKGIIRSYYFIPKDKHKAYHKYNSIEGPVWGREFPVGWRDLNKGID